MDHKAKQLCEALGEPWYAIYMTHGLDRLEEKYQQRLQEFSPAYLSGSGWYVGPSVKKYVQSLPLERSILKALGMYKLLKGVATPTPGGCDPLRRF